MLRHLPVRYRCGKPSPQPHPGPVLIIASGAVLDEPTAAQWFQAASPATVRVWVVPHSGHTAALAIQARAWEARVTSFLNAALNPAAGTAVPP